MIQFFYLLWVKLKEREMSQLNFYFTIRDMIMDYLDFKVSKNKAIAKKVK